jgi:hypothetical protein
MTTPDVTATMDGTKTGMNKASKTTTDVTRRDVTKTDVTKTDVTKTDVTKTGVRGANYTGRPPRPVGGA